MRGAGIRVRVEAGPPLPEKGHDAIIQIAHAAVDKVAQRFAGPFAGTRDAGAGATAVANAEGRARG